MAARALIGVCGAETSDHAHNPGVRPAVFLDRDDTLIENRELPWSEIGTPRGDLCDPAYVRLLPGVREACERMVNADFVLVVVSNQGLVARGVGTLADVARTNERLLELLTSEPTGRPLIERVYVCPYHPNGTVPPYNVEHPLRKPAPGMILQATQELDLHLARSWLVGDAPRDIEAGQAAGIDPARCLLVGPGRELPDLHAATRVILGA